MQGDDTNSVELREYLAVLRRRWVTILLTTLAVGGAALGSGLVATPIYQSSVTLAVEHVGGDSASLERALFGTQEIQTQLQLLLSEPVAQRVADQLGVDRSASRLLSQVNAGVIGDTRVMRIEARDVDPEMAADIAGSFAESYLALRRDDALSQVLQATADLRARTTSIRTRVDEIDRQLRSAGTDRAAALEAERASLLDQLGAISAQLATLEATETFVRGGGRVIRAAEVPRRPVEPRPIRQTILGLLVGATLGAGLAFVRDRLDDTIRSEDEAVRATDGAPVLAHIPRWRDERADAGGMQSPLPLFAAPASRPAEAIRTLRANVRFVAGRNPYRSVVVTSAVEGEGKTVTAIGLAVSAARTGQRVILVDADLRRPALHRTLGIPAGQGLSRILTGERRLPDVLVSIGESNLRVLPAGEIPPNPAELLSSDAMAELMQELAGVADFVVYDAPPVLPVADALEIANRAEATILVIDTERAGHRAVRSTRERLRRANAKLIGTVLNKHEEGDLAYDYGYYVVADAQEHPGEGHTDAVSSGETASHDAT